MVKAQVYRVGAEPMSIAGELRGCFAKQTQGTERGVDETELLGQCTFKGAPRQAFKATVSGQPFEARFGKFPERKVVVWFGPDQFRDKQGEAHGRQAGEL